MIMYTGCNERDPQGQHELALCYLILRNLRILCLGHTACVNEKRMKGGDRGGTERHPRDTVPGMFPNPENGTVGNSGKDGWKEGFFFSPDGDEGHLHGQTEN